MPGRFLPGNHGYTGHEHLPGFGLINCNARLYDPALGRFLMPDPFIQDPASTQNFNRYSYCLNNPLKYTDESGEKLIINISRNGIKIGWNFIELGIPVGFGFTYDWSEPKGKIGAFIKFGIHEEFSIMGVDLVQTIDLTAKVCATHSFKDGSNTIEGELKAKYGRGNLTAEAGLKGGIQFDKDWKVKKYMGSATITGGLSDSYVNGKVYASYNTSYDIGSDAWDNSFSIGLKVKKTYYDGSPFEYDGMADFKYTYNINKKQGAFDFNLSLGNTEEDRSVFDSEHFKLIEKYSSRVQDAQKRGKKATEEYYNYKKRTKRVL